MRIYTGIDIVEVQRVKTSIENSGPHFLDRVYTKAEQAYCNARGVHKYESYAARFAAKEAVAKAFGKGICQEVSLLMIEVSHTDSGKPYILLHGSALSLSQDMGISAMDLSLTHTAETAAASVVLLAL